MCREGDVPLIVAIDLQPMAPIEGVIQVQGDITNARTAEVVKLSQLLVICFGVCVCFFGLPFLVLFFFFSRSSGTLTVARLTWLFVMVLLMVIQFCFTIQFLPQAIETNFF